MSNVCAADRCDREISKYGLCDRHWEVLLPTYRAQLRAGFSNPQLLEHIAKESVARMDLPFWVECPGCDGETVNEHGHRCSRCKGTGQLPNTLRGDTARKARVLLKRRRKGSRHE